MLDHKYSLESSGYVYPTYLMKVVKDYNTMVEHLEAEDHFFNNFPECGKMSGLIGRGIYHEEDVWDHTLKVYSIAIEVTNNPEVLLACLLHDYGKPAAYNPETKKFTDHENIGATMVAPRLLEFFPDNTARQLRIYWLVKNHMWDRDGNKTDKKRKWWTFFRVMQDYGVTLEEFMIIRYADFRGRVQNGKWVHDGPAVPFQKFCREDNVYTWWKRYIDYLEGGIKSGTRGGSA